MGEAEDEAEAQAIEQVNEEFIVWLMNTPVLYDLVICRSLEWPSLTVEWLPSSSSLVFGTHTTDDAPNFIILADVDLTTPKVEITKWFRVDGEVNRVRCMPQKPNLIAAKTCASEVYVFDIGKDSDTSETGFEPEMRLRGHDKEGFGLSWNNFKEGFLLSCSNDSKICLWDVSALPRNCVLDAMSVYKAADDIGGHASWHTTNENVFGSVGDDGRLVIWDMRSDKPEQSVVAHEKEVNYLSFSSFNEWIVATASSDTTIGLFDLRKLTSPLHFLSSHTEEVFQVEWDPNHETVLASSSDDRRLMVWDLNRIGDEQLEGEAQDGPPELLFSHGGHRDRIADFSWNKNEPWMISSVADDNAVQVWKMAESIYRDEDELAAE